MLKEPVKGHRRAVEVVKLLQCQGLVEHQSARHGLLPQSGVIVVDGTTELPLVLPGHAAHLIGVGDERVPLYRLRGILFGSAVVIKVQLGHRTEKPGLRQIGLGCNRLVEILNRKHVILKIERILPHAHHLLGIDLRVSRQPWQNHRRSNRKNCFEE